MKIGLCLCGFCSKPVYGDQAEAGEHPCCRRWREAGFLRCVSCIEAARLRNPKLFVNSPLKLTKNMQGAPVR